LQLQQLMESLDRLAPWDLAESWDHVGLQVGSGNQPVTKVVVALDINEQVIQEGLSLKADGFVVHHPLFFKPFTQIDLHTPAGCVLAKLIKNDLFLIAAHTNIDKAAGGLNRYLADLFDLTGIELLEPVTQPSYKVVVFTPAQSLPQIRNAMAQAGAGVIGDYTDCSFGQQGNGTFKPGSQARPFLGRPAEFTEATEIRLEMSVKKYDLSKVIKEATANHPYEEPVIDVYPLINPAEHGMGRIGQLKTPLSFQNLVLEVKERLCAKEIRFVGESAKVIRKLAICSGSGGSLIMAVAKKKADAYLTGELNYHDFLFAKENGLAVIAAGHWATEHGFADLVSAYLNGFFKEETNFTAVPSGTIREEPFFTL
jgi:dinuclear metal center YbgI/SA1388 family protein